MINITFHTCMLTIAIAVYTVVNSLATQLAGRKGPIWRAWWGGAHPDILPVLTAVAAIIMVARFVPETLSGRRRLLDTIIYTGWTLIVLAAFFALIGWPFTEDNRWGLTLAVAVTVGGIGTALVIWWNRRTSQYPKVQRRFLLRDLIALVVTGLILSFVLVGYGVRTYAYFQVAMGLSNFIALLALAPILFGSLAGVFLIVRAVRHWRARVVIAGSLLTMAFSLLVTALLPFGASYLLYIIPLFIFGAGYLVGVTVWMSAFLRTAVDGYFGLNAAINRAAGMLGAAMGGGHRQFIGDRGAKLLS